MEETSAKKVTQLKDQTKFIAVSNPIQVKLKKFIQIIEPIYLTLNKSVRLRRNYRQEKVSDLVILATMLMRIQLRDPSETHFHQMMLVWGISLPERSRYNRRCRNLLLIMRFIRWQLVRKYSQSSTYEILDSAPMTLASARRSQAASVLHSQANKGFNATKETFFYGFKFHIVLNDQGYVMNWELTPASTDDRKVVEELLLTTPCTHILADGGYLSNRLKERLLTVYGIRLWTPVRKNMKQPKEDVSLLKNLRRHIETVFNNLNTVGHFEHLGIRTLKGLGIRIESMLLWQTIKVHEQLENGKSGFKIV
ncbi:transposase [Secundilactobacillus paracollinoides DSM 15502 = JCM 11969]|nr:transposase [Secundilactobacillus paracollinoides DSM 15502 = JCM 11969]